ncbi:hypothetical protein [Sphingomonas agri]|uniref:hypothetical protein n=1 Tax=Sphingomonas agri TaxID=1813878 RepID=UPI00312025BF
MFRKTDNTLRAGAAFDFLEEVDPDRLRLIAAITLQWNWIESAIDVILTTGLRIDSDIWVEVQSRINGFDGKVAIIKATLPHNTPAKMRERIGRTLNACEQFKTVRDHIIHMRLASPDEQVSESFQRRGATKEVYAAKEPLRRFYTVLRAHWDEIHWLGFIYLHLAKLLAEEPNAPARLQAREELGSALARFLESQQKREALPPLPEVPEPNLAQQVQATTEALQEQPD